MSLNFDKVTNIAVKSDFCQKQKNATKLYKKIEPSSLLQFSTSHGNIRGEQSFNLIPRAKEFRILSCVSLENISKQNNTQMLKKHQLIKNYAAEATILSSKRKHFFGVDFTSNAFRNELLPCLCIKTFVSNCFQRLKVISLR